MQRKGRKGLKFVQGASLISIYDSTTYESKGQREYKRREGLILA